MAAIVTAVGRSPGPSGCNPAAPRVAFARLRA